MEANHLEQENEDQITLEIRQLEQVEDISSSIRGKLDAISYPCSIFYVPEKFVNRQANAYCPKIVSIGPLHHGEFHLQHMENHKWEYLNALLCRKLNSDSTLDACVKVLKELEPKIRACYQGNISLPSEEFIRMILLDACFIIELFLRYAIRGLKSRDDPLLRSPEKLHVLRNDLSLLENQIPFFVIQKIFSLIPIERHPTSCTALMGEQPCDISISKLSLRFFKPLIPSDVQNLQEKYSFQGSSHLLDLIWKAYRPSFPKVPKGKGDGSGRNLHSASSLRKVGIEVKAAKAESILDIKFDNGTIFIPIVKIHNHMEALFRNLIAMEHCHSEKKKHITSYVFLLKGLIQSQKDVKLFIRREIFLRDDVGKGEELVGMFKKLCEDVELDKFYYEGMWEQLVEYGRTRLDVWYYKLKRKYGLIQWRVSTATMGVSFLLLVLIGILVVILYFFVSRHRH